MKKKGFTLIELLAIIVILAIIALIAVPVVLNIIDKAKVSSYARSSENVLESARLYFNGSYLDKTMNLSGDKYNEIADTLSGDKPDSGQIYIKEDGSIAMLLKYGDNCYVKQYDSDKITHVQGEACTVEEEEFTNDRASETVLELVTNHYKETGETENVYDAIKEQLGKEPDSAEVYVDSEGNVTMALDYSGTCYKKGISEEEITSTENESNCKVATLDKLKTLTVTSGDGLYKDSDGVYRYKGTTPNNYIMLGNEEYRIIAIEEQGIKVVRSAASIAEAFDKGGRFISSCTEETCPRNNNNNTYCLHTSTSTAYYGCNAYVPANQIKQNGVVIDTITSEFKTGTVTEYSTIYNYLHNTYYSNLSSVSSHIVQDATWNVGSVGFVSNTKLFLQDMMEDESKWTWNGKIGLINPSDYINAQLPSGEAHAECLSNIKENYMCGENNWLKPSSDNLRTINPSNWESGALLSILYNSSGARLVIRDAYYSYGIYPVVYLNSDIELSGEGTQGSGAYTIVES